MNNKYDSDVAIDGCYWCDDVFDSGYNIANKGVGNNIVGRYH